MPLERSHVIFICTVSPLIVGLAAYYLFRKNPKESLTSQIETSAPDCSLDNQETIDSEEEKNPVSPQSITKEKVIEVNSSDSFSQQQDNMTLQNHELVHNEAPDANSCSPDQLVSQKQHAEEISEDLCQESSNQVESSMEEANYSHSEHLTPDSSAPRLESNFSDTHTEVSADSGLSVNSDNLIFKFDFPSDLVGLLIGNHGRNVKMLQEKSGARVKIERSHCSVQYQVCVVEGSPQAVDVALELIRDRFPNLDLSQLSSEPAAEVTPAPIPIPQLRIPQHTYSDVCISNIASANNIYLQQPTHPYFRELEMLTQQMNACYSDYNAPLLPDPIPTGVICVAPWIDQMAFCRGLILSVNEATSSCVVRYVDHGSTVELPTNTLRQIRSDFLRLPFQATECTLANISPLDGQEEFSVEAAEYLQKITEGQVVLCWVHAFGDDGKPSVEIYLRHGLQKVSVNKLLVENGYVRSTETA